MRTITTFFLAAWLAVWPCYANPLLMLAGSPPAASGGLTDPTSISGCVLWLAADRMVYEDNGTDAAEADDAVFQWSDGSSNAKNFTQATLGSRPQLKANVVNSKPVIRFVDGSPTDMMESAAFSSYTSTTVFVVMRKDATNASGYVLNMGSSNAAIISDFGSAIVEHFTSPRLSVGASDSSAFHVYVVVNNATTPLMTTYRDGTQISTSGDSNATGASVWRIGAGSTSADGFSGDIAEVIAYSTALSNADREAVEDYLGAKYGITIN